uniref:Ymf63 n=1 Tax=Ichthyophthirius multifiliis TaxID=5932 RepID=G1FLC5_ICHMU|nr:Ymf63 [Ichthyophthirius multifiliis]AEL89267.1 Ymf63 [Ichthyophthirius multifiliis]
MLKIKKFHFKKKYKFKKKLFKKFIIKKELRVLKFKKNYHLLYSDSNFKYIYSFFRVKSLNCYNLNFCNYLNNNLDKNYIINYLQDLDIYNNFNSLKCYNNKYNFFLVNQLLNQIIKKGKKLNSIKSLISSLSNIYIDFFKDSDIIKSYQNLNQYSSYIINDNNPFNINNILNWIIEIYKPSFDIKCINVEKKYKKLYKTNRTFKLVYIPTKLRTRLSLKHIANAIDFNSNIKLNNRIYDVLLDMFLNHKKSYLYSRKLFIYNTVFKL